MGSGVGERLEPESGGGGRRREKERCSDWLACVAWREGAGLARSLG